MNVKLLEKVKAAILAEPAQFVMDHFFASNADGISALDLPRQIPNCETAACIGGWARTIGNRHGNPAKASRGRARDLHESQLLRIDDGQSERLFYLANWPGPFRARWDRARTLPARAKVAAARIDHFIKTDGAS